MNKKLIAILALCMVLCTALFGLTACGCNPPAHSHVYNKRVVNDTYLKSQANCNKKAEYYFSCECGDVGSSTFEDGALGDHNYNSCVSNGNDTHTKTCAYDNTHVVTENCYGGTATETSKAICSACNTEYGKFLEPEIADYFKFTLNQDNSSYTVSIFNEEIASQVESLEAFVAQYQDIVSLTQLSIPSKYNGLPVTAIGDYAFIVIDVENIVIPDSIKEIGEGAFFYCSKLESVTIGSGLTSIGVQAFSNCSALKNITIPNHVTSIGFWAFADCSSLTSIAIPDSIEYIDEYTFADCILLSSIIIPDSVTFIGENLFRDCSALEQVFYGGTAQDWQEIDIHENNDELTNATIYYYVENREDLPSDNGNYWHYVDGVPTIYENNN